MPTRKSQRDPDFAEAVGSRLKALRARAGLSQARVAEALNVEPSTVARMESGKRPVPLTLIPVLAGMYGATIPEVFVAGGALRDTASGGEDEHALLLRWRALRPSARRAVMGLLDELAPLTPATASLPSMAKAEDG